MSKRKAHAKALVVRLRPSLRKFAVAMELRLRANDHTKAARGWKACSDEYLLRRLSEEYEELLLELRGLSRCNPKRVCDEAADVANFAMMIADNAQA